MTLYCCSGQPQWGGSGLPRAQEQSYMHFSHTFFQHKGEYFCIKTTLFCHIPHSFNCSLHSPCIFFLWIFHKKNKAYTPIHIYPCLGLLEGCPLRLTIDSILVLHNNKYCNISHLCITKCIGGFLTSEISWVLATTSCSRRQPHIFVSSSSL